MIELVFGRPGAGKTLYNAKKTLQLLKRAEWIQKKLKVNRKVYLNFHLSPELSLQYKNFLVYWTDPMTLIELRDCDIVVDEIAVYFPAERWKDTPLELRRFFAQHRKRGIEIYANTQDYKMVDINFRRMVHRCYVCRKLCGNRNPSATLPKINFLWGIIVMREYDPRDLEQESSLEHPMGIFPDWFLIRKKLVNAYNTAEDIKAVSLPMLHHEERICENEKCTAGYGRIRYKQVRHF